MNRERLDDWCEKGILVLLLALLIYGPLAMGGMRNQEWAIQLAFILGAAVIWVVRMWLNREFRVLWSPVCWGVLAFVIYALARYPFATVEYSARAELVRVLAYGLLFFVVLNNINHRQSRGH